MIARLWSPWMQQSCGRLPLASWRDDQTRILGSFPIWPVTTRTRSGWMSIAVMSSSWPLKKSCGGDRAEVRAPKARGGRAGRRRWGQPRPRDGEKRARSPPRRRRVAHLCVPLLVVHDADRGRVVDQPAVGVVEEVLAHAPPRVAEDEVELQRVAARAHARQVVRLAMVVGADVVRRREGPPVRCVGLTKQLRFAAQARREARGAGRRRRCSGICGSGRSLEGTRPRWAASPEERGTVNPAGPAP